MTTQTETAPLSGKFNILVGDCRVRLKELADNSVDSIVTDPPYELGFMGKSWDSTGIAYDKEVWTECLRVLKPGGHLLAFSGTRTQHRMVCAIEDAGFEIRDQIGWVYGSGFPKSLNVAKAITATETTGGSSPKNLRMARQGDDYEPTGQEDYRAGRAFSSDIENDLRDTQLTDNGEKWAGWGTALKPAWEPICVARKPFIGTVAANVLQYGTGGINIEGCRVGTEKRDNPEAGYIRRGRTDEEVFFGTDKARPAGVHEVNGRWPANVIHDGSPEIVAMFPNVKTGGAGQEKDGEGSYFGGGMNTAANHYADDGSAARFFYCAKTSKSDRDEGLYGFEGKPAPYEAYRENPGAKGGDTPYAGAGRAGGNRNNHPTVKPTDLMRYLCRLVTPPGGLVLDPFTGSGSTGKAAMLEDFRFVGCELCEEYAAIAEARINAAMRTPVQTMLF